MPTAIKISGRSGRNQLINDTYEPMQITHHDRPCWVARAVAPRYLFHSGKSRWVISKQIDDGARCWAYVQDSGSSQDPSSCPGPWTVCDQDNQWREDAAVKCVSVPADHDKFVQLRMTLDAEMRQYGLIDPKNLKELWKRLDYNGNNVVSLAEIDKMVVELVAGGTWPAWLNNKPALMRAYKKTILKDGDGDDWVERHEFHALLLNIFWFNKLWQVYEAVDTGHDRRMDIGEFMSGLSKMGLQLSQAEAQQEFASIDGNHGGQVLFVEFCAYVRKRVNPDDHPNFDADIVSGEHATRAVRNHRGHEATHEHVISKKCFRDFDELEKKIQATLANPRECRKLWTVLDFNGNQIVSLAEIDKLCVEQYPLLNHKPALMRAYKKAISKSGGGNGDDWVQKKEFKKLMAYIFYFNKVFWLFEQGMDSTDRRLNFQDFKKCLLVIGVKLSDADMRRDFSACDKNGGGWVLFDEFCAFVASKNCPQAMTDMLD
eukprot:TRINITY_DN3162_c1_g1_i2.p1 TRINITY_DN3162_c1_g1~~TRINITY_DN3162_c1_g1_i2.p1  ORF type:complete len:487 (-),score=99.07 TRINITY_DN3162_c1_g1_i2:79-1539(-)